MRCLVVGGTGFLGGAITDALVDEGHSVAVLARGSTTRRTSADVEVIIADRYGPLGSLKERKFDWVFDTCAYAPDAVRFLLGAIGDGVARYCAISSISAYGTFFRPRLDETETVPAASDRDYAVAAAVPAENRASADAYGSSYGPLKRACEIEAQRILGDRATALRVGLLVGAGDYTDRLTWWVRRIDSVRGAFPAPAPPERPVQLIDVRDAAKFAVRCAERGLSGVWNVTGRPQEFAGVLAAIIDATGSDAEAIWVSETAILDARITPWTDIPMMAPPRPSFRYFMDVSTQKAEAAGLQCRPLRETLIPLIAWDRSRRNVPLKGGMSAEQEAQLLEYQMRPDPLP